MKKHALRQRTSSHVQHADLRMAKVWTEGVSAAYKAHSADDRRESRVACDKSSEQSEKWQTELTRENIDICYKTESALKKPWWQGNGHSGVGAGGQACR
jgi:hypothetical protein